MDQSDIDRFRAKVEMRGPQDCWEWQGHRHVAGYGIFWVDGRNVRANRIALLVDGKPQPFPEALALHGCDNPPCCNPNHLRWGTTQENVDDKIMRRGPMKGENSHAATITNSTVDTIYAMRMDGYRAREICKALSLPFPLVENVYTGRSWSHRLGVDGNPTLEILRAKRRPRTRRVSHNRIVTDAMVDHILKARIAGISARDIAAELKLPLGTVTPVHSGLAFTYRHGVDGNPTLEQLRRVKAVPKNLKLTDDDVDEIRRLLAKGYLGADIAALYSVSRVIVSNIKTGKRHSKPAS